MKTYQPADIRNFAIVGHASSGKTMLSEAMLACSGVISRMGRIADGSTVSDYHVSEKNRQISVSASLLHTEWAGKKFNIIDTPGYLDFISEGLGALRVGDFALVVIHAQHGLGVGTERVWDYATNYGIPKMIVVNAVDKENFDFDAVVKQVQERFGRHVFPLSFPLNPGPGFNRVLDVLRKEIVTYATDYSGKYKEEPVTGEWEAKWNEMHGQLIEHIAESDDELMNKFFEQGGLSEEEFRAGIHAAVQKQLFIPIFCTSAENNIGVARLMDFIAKYGSSPVDRRKVKAFNANDAEVEVALDNPEPVLYIFKTMSEAHFGELSFFRIYAGSVSTGMDLFNSDR
ncbi:MAG: GTP-binding protein, partial [Verrucomicrobiota bacterium]